jgi:hypothetical protein
MDTGLGQENAIKQILGRGRTLRQYGNRYS